MADQNPLDPKQPNALDPKPSNALDPMRSPSPLGNPTAASVRTVAAPRAAGTLVLARDGADGLEVLMVRRGRGAAFMADAYVFPGGRVEKDEPGGAPGAAIREAFEEAGVLLARPAAASSGSDMIRLDGEPWTKEARRGLAGRTLALRALLDERGLALATDALAPFARWITPESEPRRYDTFFFLAAMPPGQTAAPDDVEVSEHRWATPAALLEADRRRELKLPPPTQWHLRDLSALRTVEEALAWARARHAAIGDRAVRPKLVPDGETVAVVLPWDEAFAALPASEPECAPVPVEDPLGLPLSRAITRFRLVDGSWLPAPNP